MKQVWITKHGSPEVLMVRETHDLTPEKGEVLIDVHFSGINFADILARMGLYPDAPKVPCVVGYEVSGIVEKVGRDVDESWLWKRVIAFTRFGGYSSKLCVSVEYAFELSGTVSLEEGAALPVTYLTAYLMMISMANLKAGETVLIHGVGGGVGIAALQIAKTVGAKVIGTASAWKHDQLKKMGVEHIIDYYHEDFVAKIMELTKGKGVNLVLDPVAGKNVIRSYQCLRPLGKVVVYGISSAAHGNKRNSLSAAKMFFDTKRFHPISLMNDNRGVLGLNVGHLWREREILREAATQIVSWLNEEKIRPVVDKVFSFEQASGAHAYIHEHKNLGKVLLSPKL